MAYPVAAAGLDQRLDPVKSPFRIAQHPVDVRLLPVEDKCCQPAQGGHGAHGQPAAEEYAAQISEPYAQGPRRGIAGSQDHGHGNQAGSRPQQEQQN